MPASGSVFSGGYLAPSMALLAIFGIENDGLNLAVNLLLLFLVVIWLALVYWTFADARRRIADPMLVGCATGVAVPFIGTIIYLIVARRSTWTTCERDLEIAAAQARLQNRAPALPVLRVRGRSRSCVVRAACRLKEPCTVCGKPLDPRWKICPYCEAEVGQAPPEARRARPRRAAPAAAAGGAVPRAARPAQAARQPPAEEAPRSDPLGRAATGLIGRRTAPPSLTSLTPPLNREENVWTGP